MTVVSKRSGADKPKATGQPTSAVVLPGWRLARRLRDCYRAFTGELQSRLDTHGMRVSDWSHLRVIWDEQGLTQVEVSRRLGIEKASSTLVLEKLRTLGLVRGERQPSDRRKVGIYLTPKGLALVEDMVPRVAAAIGTATRDIPEEDIAHFIRVIDRMTANLEEAGEQGRRGRRGRSPSIGKLSISGRAAE